MLNDPVVIVGVARTPMGAFQGDFASLAIASVTRLWASARSSSSASFPSPVVTRSGRLSCVRAIYASAVDDRDGRIALPSRDQLGPTSRVVADAKALPTWPDGHIQTVQRNVDPNTVRMTGVVWLLADDYVHPSQPFNATVRVTPSRTSLDSYTLRLGDAAIGLARGSDRLRRSWPDVERWLFEFTRPMPSPPGNVG